MCVCAVTQRIVSKETTNEIKDNKQLVVGDRDIDSWSLCYVIIICSN